MFPNQLNNVVIVIESQADAPYVLEKTRALLANVGSDGPTVHVVRVVHEAIADLKTRHIDRSRELKSLILQAAENELVDILDAHASGIERLESMTLWNATAWEGILHFAESNDADLIIKASQWQGSTHAIGRTPDDWNLLRHASAPVMLVKDAAWSAQPRVVAAVDAFDENHGGLGIDILRSASSLRSRLGGDDLQVVSVYPFLEPWIGNLGSGVGYRDLRENIEKDIEDEIARFVRAAELDNFNLRVAEGPTVHAIESAVKAGRADILVVGTHARDGIRGVVLGNTAEKLLFGVEVDVLVVRTQG